MSTKVELVGSTLTVTRVYDAAREDVFDAWIEVSKVQQWWGCQNTTEVRSEIEPTVGGKYRHEMTLGEIGVFTVEGRITEFSPPELLVYVVDAAGPEADAPELPTIVTVRFKDLGGKTEVHLTHTGITDPMAREHVPLGWTAAFEKLALLVAA